MGLQLNHIYQGDCLAVLRQLPAESVHCCVTSPPYWGLRDYGTDGQLGLEKTPEHYIEKMVAVFQEVRRVLRDDGTLWLNMGDSYVSGKGRYSSIQQTISGKPRNEPTSGNRPDQRDHPYLKDKDLCGIPWRLALALQADGWYLRCDIIWAKPNPMPESVTDRPTKAHEYLFLLTKKARYYYDADAVREGYPQSTIERMKYSHSKINTDNNGSVFTTKGNPERTKIEPNPSGCNRRSVWTIPTASFPQAHFATFPPKLVEPCIKAGTSEWGCCPECGAGWVRVVETSKDYNSIRTDTGKPRKKKLINLGGKAIQNTGGGYYHKENYVTQSKTLYWEPSCKCECEERVPAVVLDLFMGAGTVALVAKNLGRKYVGIELNSEYIRIANNRLRQEILL